MLNFDSQNSLNADGVTGRDDKYWMSIPFPISPDRSDALDNPLPLNWILSQSGTIRDRILTYSYSTSVTSKGTYKVMVYSNGCSNTSPSDPVPTPKNAHTFSKLPDKTECECGHFKSIHYIPHDELAECRRNVDCDCKKFRPITEEMSKKREKKTREAREEEKGKNKARKQAEDLLKWAEKMKKSDEADKYKQ